MSLLLKSLTRLDTRPLSAPPEDTDTAQTLLVVASTTPSPYEDAAEHEVEPTEANFSPTDLATANPSLEPEPATSPQPIAVLKSESQPAVPRANITTDPPTAKPSPASASSQSLNQLERLLALELNQPEAAKSLPPQASFEPIPLLPAPAPIEVQPVVRPIAPVPELTSTIALSLALLPAPQPLQLRQEFRELRDHLLTKFPLQQHSTLLFVDAGRTPTDASWLVPFAASLLDHLTTNRQPATSNGSNEAQQQTPRILLIESAGPQSGIARSLGLETGPGLAEIARGELAWPGALQSTPYPNLQLLSAGEKTLSAAQFTALPNLWPDLKNHFDLILIAAGPIPHQSVESNSARPQSNPIPATVFFPLADAAILSLELNATPRLAAENAKRTLTAAGLNLLGCVVRQ
jgi:hypothetical protein